MAPHQINTAEQVRPYEIRSNRIPDAEREPTFVNARIASQANP